MLEEKKIANEEAIRFLDVLENENEEELTHIIETIQDVEQKMREAEYTLREFDQKQDSNMNFFSPIGVYEEGEEKRNLLRTTEELQEQLPKLNEKLEQYKYRREQLQFIRNSFLATQNYTAAPTSIEYSAVDKEQGVKILESHEYERNRIARDLHDSSVQSLTSLIHKTELCMRLMDIDTIRVKLELQTIIETVRAVINGMREIIYNLRPMSLDNLGLTVTVDAYCLQLKKNYDIEVELKNLSDEPDFPSIYKVTLYRILQETCGNIVKHAKASKIDVTLSCEDNKLKMVVQDNGVGFDIQKVEKPSGEKLNGFGLLMMKERIALLGGTIRIESTVGQGTVVYVEVPMQEKEDMSGDD